MKIGIPKEIKTNENRVSLVPAGAVALVSDGHTVIVETGAGLGSGFSDALYLAAGAQIAKDADVVWAAADDVASGEFSQCQSPDRDANPALSKTASSFAKGYVGQ